MQVLYQIDLRGEADGEAIRESLADGPDNAATAAEAYTLAWDAWAARAAADAAVSAVADEWPTHRQPPVDRAILRLAHYEMVAGRSQIKIAINEAIELAKTFGSDQSAAFINGVLDKLARTITESQPQHPAPADAMPR
jgi:N utilization substance protein B